jgi:hypothetical protein
MWALSIPSLATVSGFPVQLSGPAANDPTRYFLGGTVLQRPGLTSIGDALLLDSVAIVMALTSLVCLLQSARPRAREL